MALPNRWQKFIDVRLSGALLEKARSTYVTEAPPVAFGEWILSVIDTALSGPLYQDVALVHARRQAIDAVAAGARASISHAISEAAANYATAPARTPRAQALRREYDAIPPPPILK